MLIKKGGLKNLINHTGKMPMWKSPLNKTASPHVRSFIKKRLQHQCPPPPPPSPPKKNKQTNSQNIQEHPSLQNTSNNGSRWRNAKYNLL